MTLMSNYDVTDFLKTVSEKIQFQMFLVFNHAWDPDFVKN